MAKYCMAKTSDTSVQNAIVDMAKALSVVYKRYAKPSRTKAWNKLTDTSGQKEMAKLLQDPNRSLNIFRQLQFREWLESGD